MERGWARDAVVGRTMMYMPRKMEGMHSSSPPRETTAEISVEKKATQTKEEASVSGYSLAPGESCAHSGHVTRRASISGASVARPASPPSRISRSRPAVAMGGSNCRRAEGNVAG